MPLNHILILGAGPAGLSAAIALAQLSPPPPATRLRITVLELRSQITTLGGSVNLTPLAMRYLDHLGAGSRVRARGIRVSAIELLSLRTGTLLGRLWPDVDALRVRRIDLVTSLMETAKTPEIAERVTVRFDVRVAGIHEMEDPVTRETRVILTLESGETIEGDLLIGCDGLHSVARTLYVEPEREESYSGKAVAYGFVRVAEPGDAGYRRSDGESAVVDTTLITGQYGSFLTSFCNPAREELHVAAVMQMADEQDDSKDGWKARGDDKARVKQDIVTRFQGGNVQGLAGLIGRVEDWSLFPVYQLPPRGRWHRGRVIIIGDAAHAVSTVPFLSFRAHAN